MALGLSMMANTASFAMFAFSCGPNVTTMRLRTTAATRRTHSPSYLVGGEGAVLAGAHGGQHQREERLNHVVEVDGAGGHDTTRRQHRVE
jgi:hypothetical protein